MILINKRLLGKKVNGMTIYPFILLKNREMKEDEYLLNHERIHLRQQIEMLVIPFYLWYGIEFLLRLMAFKNIDVAYRNICFEREAYANERDLEYLKKRKTWSFLNYLGK